MKKILFALMTLLMTVSCNNYKAEKEQLTLQNDSLRISAAKAAAEYEDMLSLLNEIEDGFKEIKSAENYLTIQSAQKGDIPATTRERIKSDFTFVTNALQRNREQIATLEGKLKNSNFQSVQLKKRLESLNATLEENSRTIVVLKGELSKRDESIRNLTANVQTLKGDVADLEKMSSNQQETIQSQDSELNMAWYIFGTAKELRDWKVIEGGTLFKKTNMLMNKEMFTKIDIRSLKEIPLKAKKAKVMTDHPASSYSLQADENKMMTLIIIDQKEFWSISKYLVVKVD